MMVWYRVILQRQPWFRIIQVSELLHSDHMITYIYRILYTGWWFLIFSIFIPIWGKNPNLTSIFFNWGWNHHLGIHLCLIYSFPTSLPQPLISMSSNAQWEQTIGMLEGSKDWTVERLDGKGWEDKNGWDKMKFTPENSWNHMEPKNHPIEKNKYLPNLHFWVQNVNFPGCFQDNGNSERILPLTTLTKARCVSLRFFQLVQWVFTGPDLANGNGLRCDGWRQIVIPLQGRQFQKGIQPSKWAYLFKNM